MLPFFVEALFRGNRFGQLTSNIAESLNAVFLEARALPPIPLIEKIRQTTMGKFNERRIVSESLETRFVPSIEEQLRGNRELARRHRVRQSSADEFEVESSRRTLKVILSSWFCSCGKWMALGYPCSHAIAAILHQHLDPYDFVSDYYDSDCYRETYQDPVVTMPSQEYWVRVDDDLAPPTSRRPPGRPKKSALEVEMKVYH